MAKSLPPHQFKRLSDFFADIAQVSLASVAVPFLIDEFNLLRASLGIGFALFFYAMSFSANKHAL